MRRKPGGRPRFPGRLISDGSAPGVPEPTAMSHCETSRLEVSFSSLFSFSLAAELLEQLRQALQAVRRNRVVTREFEVFHL